MSIINIMGCVNSNRTNPKSIVIISKNTDAKLPFNSIKEKDLDLSESQNLKKIKSETSHFVIKDFKKLKENYSFDKILNQTAHSLIRTAVHKPSGQLRLIKSIQKSGLSTEEGKIFFFTELNILKILDHPNIVKIFDFYEDKTFYHIIAEYIEDGLLFDYIVKSSSLSENIISSLIQQMLCAVSYCHDNNVAHREINPECLFFDGSGEVPIVKIMNYGTFYLKPSVENSFYTAPEIVNNKNCDEKCDV